MLKAVPDILKVGFSGLVFLFAYLGYRLLSKEQGRDKPDPKVLNAIAAYRSYTLIAAVLAVAAMVIQLSFQARSMTALIRSSGPACGKQLERIDTILTATPQPTELEAAVRLEVSACRDYVLNLSQVSP